MAKEKEKRIALDYYITGMTAKAIAEIVNVNEKTIGNWITTGNWKNLRDSNLNSDEHSIKNIKSLISEFTEQQIELVNLIKEAQASGDKEEVALLRKQSSFISQEVAIQNKALENLEKKQKTTLTQYLKIMHDVFKQMQEYDKKLYHDILDFQDYLLQHITRTL